jgi:hypothetical protein
VPLKDGRAVLCPAGSSCVGIFDSRSNTFVRGAAHNCGAYAFWGGVQLPNNQILLVPSHSKVIGIYDAEKDRFITGPIHGCDNVRTTSGGGCGAFLGGAITEDEKTVIMSPYWSKNVGLVYL